MWLIAVSLFACLLKRHRFTFGAAVVLALLAHSLAALCLDRFFFDGRLTASQWIGVCCAIAALILINSGGMSLNAGGTQ